MNIPSFVKPGIWGAVIGAVGIAVVGFYFGGWVTGAAAEKMASQRGQSEVVAALVPVCLELAKADPNATNVMQELQKASSYQRRDVLINAGWATMPGSTDANRDVALACANSLAANF